jgi:riboflavin kinase
LIQEIHILRPLSQPSPAPPAAADAKSELFHKLPDFYGTRLNLLILGYIRPEYDYVSVEALIEDIRIDCDVARDSLRRKAYVGYLEEEDATDGPVTEEKRWLRSF